MGKFIKIIYRIQFIINLIFLIIHDSRNAGEASGITGEVVGNLLFWVTTIITSCFALVPFFIIRRADYHFSENIISNVRQKKYEHDYAKKVYVKKLEQITKATRSIAKFKRLYKESNMQADNYADKQLIELVKLFKNNRKSNPIKQVNKNLVDEVPKIIVKHRRSRSDTNLKININLNSEFHHIEKKEINDVNENLSSSKMNNCSEFSDNNNSYKINKVRVVPSLFFKDKLEIIN